MGEETNSGSVVRKKRKINWIVVLMGIFFFILAFLVYTSFFNSNSGQITGNVVKGGVLGGVSINVNLDPPESFKMDGNVDKLDMKIKGAFFIEGKKYDLDSSSIVMDNFNGKINFNDEKVNVEGKTSKIFIEGIPISGKLKVKFDNEYSYLKLGNLYLKSLDYDASGIVRLDDDKVVVNLNEEKFNVKKFYGDLEKRGSIFRLNGFVDEASAGLISVKSSDR